MGIYQGLAELRKRNGRLIVTSSKTSVGGPHGYMKFVKSEGIPRIYIDGSDSLEEQIKTLIHEAFHVSPIFINNSIICRERMKLIELDGPDREEHEEIERLTAEVFDNQPVLVDCLRYLLRKGKTELDIRSYLNKRKDDTRQSTFEFID